MFAMEGVKVPPENWTISCAVSEVCVPPIVFVSHHVNGTCKSTLCKSNLSPAA